MGCRGDQKCNRKERFLHYLSTCTYAHIQKLQPFFPPFEPLQSLNLRAALFRCLNELKKNGVLGRDVMLRKTMLDECKGEKFEDMLLAFSTVVLRQKLGTENTGRECIAMRLAFARNIALEEQKSMLPLAIAHRASLTALLRKKKRLGTNFREFQRLLDAKEQELITRAEKLESLAERHTRSNMPTDSIQELRKHLITYWHGDAKWVDVIIYGDQSKENDPILGKPFPEVWSQVENGSIGQPRATKHPGLLHDLEKRVAGQQARLQRWQDFKNDLSKNSTFARSASKQAVGSGLKRGIDLDLHRHQDLNIDSKTLRGMNHGSESTKGQSAHVMVEEYEHLMNSMKSELAMVGRESKRSGSLPDNHKGRMGVPINNWHKAESPEALAIGVQYQVPAQRMEDLSVMPETVANTVSKIPRWSRGKDVTETVAINSDSESENQEKRDLSPTPEASELPVRDGSESSTGSRANDGPSNTTSDTSMSSKMTPQTQSTEPPSDEVDEEQRLAQQIISSVANAEPSPVKLKPSLVERTRRSMAFLKLGEMQHIESPSLLSPLPIENFGPSPETLDPFDASHSTLLERTRQSMSLVPPKSRETQKSIHKHRQSKVYPTNQFETPKKQESNTGDDSKGSTPREELFSQEADYASVFKSRPKIALSPRIVPMLGEPLGMDDIIEGLGEDDSDEQLGSSPLARATAGRVGR